MTATATARTLPLATVQRCFRVMGCASQVMITGGTDLQLDHAEAQLRRFEASWSRFLPSSDITAVNQAAGQATAVHADTIAVVQRAIEAWKQTRGLFDITVLPALVHHGYTHSATGHVPAPRVSQQMIGVSGSIEVDAARGTIAVPAGAAIDLGGIGKGFAADRVVEDLVAAGAVGALVNIGGDIAARGFAAPGDAAWEVGVEDPHDAPRLIAMVVFGSGGIATSGTTIRHWTSANGETAHHLIDPATAKPAATSLLTATVIAADAATAEAFATAAMMGDGPTAIALLESVGLAGLVVARDGVTSTTSSWELFSR